MGTRSRIGIKQEDGKIKSVYCHWDGYPSNNGKILLENYITKEQVEELLSHGDMSSLYKNCNGADGHTYDKPVKDQTIYYHRDRGETLNSAVIHDTPDDANQEEYLYVFETDKWIVHEGGSRMTIQEAIEKDS